MFRDLYIGQPQIAAGSNEELEAGQFCSMFCYGTLYESRYLQRYRYWNIIVLPRPRQHAESEEKHTYRIFITTELRII